MTRTNAELVQEIRYEVLGGMGHQDSNLDDRFILRKINETKAYLAKKSAFESNNLDGITFSDGAFFSMYKNISVSTDSDVGLKYIELPANPIGLPRSRAFKVIPTASYGGGASTAFKPIGIHEVHSLMSLPKVPGVIFFYLEGGRIYFIQKGTGYMTHTQVHLRVASSGGTNMTDVCSLPEDVIYELKQIIIPQLRAMLATPQDVTTDGQDIKTA